MQHEGQKCLTPSGFPAPQVTMTPKQGLGRDKRGGWQGAGGFWELPLLLPLLPIAQPAATAGSSASAALPLQAP